MTLPRRASNASGMAHDPWGVRQSYFFEPDMVDTGVRTFKRE